MPKFGRTCPAAIRPANFIRKKFLRELTEASSPFLQNHDFHGDSNRTDLGQLEMPNFRAMVVLAIFTVEITESFYRFPPGRLKSKK
ncbi:MAG: hypothetical protein JRI92_11340 [Deltaproteobacteria bacterium]|nr:hypothetical protein [Deltaproteobacteria bacterium]